MAEMWHKCVPVSTLRVSKGCRKGVERVSKKVENRPFIVIYHKSVDKLPTLRHFADTLPTGGVSKLFVYCHNNNSQYPIQFDTFNIFLAHLKKK